MTTDAQGLELSGATADAAAHYAEAVRAFNVYRGDPMAALEQAILIAPGFAMAHVVKAHLLALATEPAATEQARGLLAAAKALCLDEREASHVAALEPLLDGEWTRAAELLDRHNMRWPHDIVALQSGHVIDFFRANARNLRDRISRVLPHWSASTPGSAIPARASSMSPTASRRTVTRLSRRRSRR